MVLVGNYLANGLNSIIIKKAMKYPSLDKKKYNTGDLATLANVDS